MTNISVEAYSADEKKDCVSENKGNASDVEKSPSDNNVGNDKRRLRRDRSPIVKERSVKGMVKWFSVRKGYGFIHREDEDVDIFFHTSAIVRQTRQPLFLAENQEVEFDIVKGIKGLEASCISGPEGQRVGTFMTPYAFRPPIAYRRRSEGDSGGKRGGQPKAITDGNGSGNNNKPPKTNNKPRFRKRPARKSSDEGGKENKKEADESQSGEENDKENKPQEEPVKKV